MGVLDNLVAKCEFYFWTNHQKCFTMYLIFIFRHCNRSWILCGVNAFLWHQQQVASREQWWRTSEGKYSKNKQLQPCLSFFLRSITTHSVACWWNSLKPLADWCLRAEKCHALLDSQPEWTSSYMSSRTWMPENMSALWLATPRRLMST